MSFIPLGVGDAFSTRYYSYSIVVEAEGTTLLIDCPHPIRKMLHEASATSGFPVDLPDVDAVLLTHLHADHCSGVEGYGFFSYFILGRRGRILAHPDVLAKLWDGHLAGGMHRLFDDSGDGYEYPTLETYFETLPLSIEHPVRFGPFDIVCRFTHHPVPTTALRITVGDRTLGISSDTDFDPTLIEWLSEADLFIHETNRGVHTHYEPLAELPAEVRAKMRLIHYPDDFDIETSAIQALEQGKRYLV